MKESFINIEIPMPRDYKYLYLTIYPLSELRKKNT